MLYVGDTYMLFYIPASVNTVGYTSLYTFVFLECLISVKYKGI